jgi:hypothetical protein
MPILLGFVKLVSETGSVVVDPVIKTSCVYWDESSRNKSIYFEKKNAYTKMA